MKGGDAVLLAFRHLEAEAVKGEGMSGVGDETRVMSCPAGDRKQGREDRFADAARSCALAPELEHMCMLAAAMAFATPIILAHLIAAAIGFAVWVFRPAGRPAGAGDLLGIIGLPVIVLAALAYREDSPVTAIGSIKAWYMIYLFISFGVLPLVTVLLSFLAGRLIGRVVALRFRRDEREGR